MQGRELEIQCQVVFYQDLRDQISIFCRPEQPRDNLVITRKRWQCVAATLPTRVTPILPTAGKDAS